MAIKRIKEIKNIDAFETFCWDGEDFKTYNLVYGWNGSGKTTVSRILNFIERKIIHIPELQSIEFTVQFDESLIKKQDIENNSLSIRVFNEDFIKENLAFESSEAKKIIIVGKDNIDTQKKLTALEAELKRKEDEWTQLDTQLSKIGRLDAILKEAGGEVPRQFGNTPLANDKYYGRSYNRSKVEARINNGTVSESNLSVLIISDPADIDAKKEVVKSEKGKIDLVLKQIADFSHLFQSANDLMGVVVNVESIDELEADKELRDWTESGYKLHKDRKLNACKFCGGNLPKGRLDRLGNFFTDELQKIKDQIDETVSKLSLDSKEVEINLDSSLLFPEFTKDYIELQATITDKGKILLDKIRSLKEGLISKKDCLHEQSKKFSHIDFPKEAFENINEAIEKINNIIVQHNAKFDVIEDEIKKAAEDIELHIIAAVLSNKEYFKKKKETEETEKKIASIKSKSALLAEKINSLKATLHNASDALNKINQTLKDFFGESHIFLEIAERAEGVGYALKRRGKDAKHLSEGEKSILALVYFLVKLEEDGFDKNNAVVVIDDPVDSQDGNFLFRTYGFLKRQLKDVHQLIILTHNYEFFNLIRDWLCEPTIRSKSHLFIMNRVSDGGQKVNIENLPTLLQEYKTEYHYLCCRLFQYFNETSIIDAPLIANIGRKILEYFATFKWSCKSTEEFSNIVLSRFINDPDHLKKGTGDFILKFVHEYSHGRNFSRDVSAPALEAKSIAKNVLEFIRFADKEHYGYLKALCTAVPDA
ncbi:MAG: AAA family ATPase [Candidatus Aureabacteria bacterium]|nr:AAA family ATPase [Candidatus Auribacterota bacterium]